MKRTVVILLLFISGNLVFAQQQFYRMRKLAQYNNPGLPKVDGTDIWNDLTGYFDPLTNKEYIIAGGTDSVYFFDITIPSQMKLVDVEFGSARLARNRDFETYKHYVYCVSDQSATAAALQIFDLQYLPDSVHKVYQSSELGSSTHTIFIESVSERMYMCINKKSSGSSAMDIISLTNPELPVLITALKVPTMNGFPLFNSVHEMYARNDTAYLSCGNAGLYIFDLRDTGMQTILGSITTYPDQGYNHSSMLDKTGRYLMFTDENEGLDIKIFDIKNLADPKFVSQFNSNAHATPHNAFWVGDLAYVSSYHDGVRVYDVKDPGNPKAVAWYDTHPDMPEIYGGYKGCWGVYPYLPSKHIIASDLTNGIFVFEIDSDLVGLTAFNLNTTHFNIYPNPANELLYLNGNFTANATVQILDLQSKVCIQQQIEAESSIINIADLSPGAYSVKLQTPQGAIVKKFIRW
ncbi:MAG: choice-of-anchor B family protein [Bacteroidia bacterium]|nr:choice-of-anchor B family protein [Bacteroidia bacterium]